MVKFPVYAFDEVDLNIFGSRITEYVLEDQDIEQNIYRCFDSEGYCVHINLSQGRQTPERGGLCVIDFREALIQTLRYFDPTVSRDLSVDELQKRILKLMKDDIHW